MIFTLRSNASIQISLTARWAVNFPAVFNSTRFSSDGAVRLFDESRGQGGTA